jgi:multidrug efflux system membrane fusion protein
LKPNAKVIAPIAVFSVALAVTVALVAARPSARSERPEIPAPLVQVMRVEPESVFLSVSAQGTVEPGVESELVAEVSGRIVWVSPQLASGGFFEGNEVLVRVDSRDYEVALRGARAALARAESNLTYAQATLDRQQSMRQTGASSRARLDEAVFAHSSAQAGVQEASVAVERAELDLTRTEIAAPFAGRVRDKHVDVGQFVGRGVPVARVYSVDYAEIRLPIRDAELAYLDLASLRDTANADSQDAEQPVPSTVAVEVSARFAGERHTWPGRIVRTEGALDPRTRMLNVVARVDDPYGRATPSERPALAVGLFVDAEIRGRSVDGVYELPRSALRRGDEVLVVDSEQRLRVRRVHVLRSAGGRSWISEGLAPGEHIVTSPIEIVTEGMEVRAEVVESESAGATAADRSRRERFAS